MGSPIYEGAIYDEVMAPKSYVALEMDAGQVLRIEDLEGVQCCDVVAFNRHDYKERYSPSNTVNLNRHVYLGKGKPLYSTRCNTMLTIVEDTVGHHDCVCGSCSPELNRARYGKKAEGKVTCRENLRDAVASYGIPLEDVPYSFNPWMDFPIAEDGSISYGETLSKAGDYIDLRADMDLLVAISNCPQELNPANGYKCTPLRAAIFSGE